jgi:predicted esterase
VFVSHGTADAILPIDACSRSFVPVLRQAGYDVEYHEFDGATPCLPRCRTPASLVARADGG